MTIANANRRARFEGNGATTSFTFDFTIPNEEDLLVVKSDPDGRETTLTLGVDYSVTGSGGEDGGFVLYPLSGPPLASGHYLTMVRNLPFTQELDLQNQGPWLPEVVEAALDRLTILTQQLLEQSDRTLRYPVGAEAADGILPSPSGAALLGFTEEGQLTTMPVATQTLPRTNVYVSGEDTTGGYLGAKVNAGAGLEVEIANPGAFESLTLSCPLAGRVTVDDATPGYLYDKVEAGGGVAVTLGGAAGDETLVVAALGQVRTSDADGALDYLVAKLEGGDGVTVDEHESGGVLRARIAVNGGGLRRVTVFTASGAYVKPAWLKYAEVCAVGGGGGGRYGAGFGGGGGGCAWKFLDASALSASESVTVGAGGAGGTSGLQNGTAGSDSSLGAHCTGGGGASGASGAGGAATGGTVNLPGSCGFGALLTPGGVSVGFGGAASGPFGGGRGAAYGGGGDSGTFDGVETSTDGAPGAAGIVVVKEYSV